VINRMAVALFIPQQDGASTY